VVLDRLLCGGPVTISDRFDAAVAASAGDLPDPALLPVRLARAVAQVLPVDGAGISLFFATGRRLPLGASDESAAEAERLQFTVGEGPCLSAVAAGRPVLADEATIAARWPAFHDDLVSRTPVRAVISLPLVDGQRQCFGALDLYLVPPKDIGAVRLFDALEVTREVVSVFQAASRPSLRGSDGPAWLDAPAAGRRSLVWQAMGFVNAGLHVTAEDALALLRAHAYSEGRDLDDLAADVLSGDVSLAELVEDRYQAG
jgi:hypothetical protein